MNKDLILLDSNIIIYALKNDPTVYSFVNNKRLAISFITEVELLGWKNIAPGDQKLIADFLEQCLYIDYNYHIRQQTISVKQQYNLKLGDAFIAATSLEFDIPLVSADHGFSRVKELNFIHILPNNE
jgi:predicted nucleic acid-binding protein